ncbi:MAG: (2Fe-2S) ferredoxin domain-containing protein [Gammaproteobacteria bacterium]
MPKPEKHVFICVQQRPPGHPRGSCAEKGCGEIYEEFMNELQVRNCFDKVAITNTGCLGPCMTGPSVLVYPEGVMYGITNKEDVKEVFDSHLLGDTVVDRLKVPEEIWG